MFAVIMKNLNKEIKLKVICSRDVNGMANSEDPDQTASNSSLIWVCTVCQGLSV